MKFKKSSLISTEHTMADKVPLEARILYLYKSRRRGATESDMRLHSLETGAFYKLCDDEVGFPLSDYHIQSDLPNLPEPDQDVHGILNKL